jgi:hypothetical protein
MKHVKFNQLLTPNFLTMKHLKLIPLLMLTAFVFVACDDDDDAPQVVNESEVITNLTIELSGPNTVTLTSVDLDGPDGPNAPTVSVVGSLAANSTYTGSIELLDDSDPSDIEDITEEVEEEDLEHQFVFCVEAGLNATISGENLDSNGDTLGTMFTLTTADASTGDITFTLVHEGDKSANVDPCDISALATNGEIDITQSFELNIQ